MTSRLFIALDIPDEGLDQLIDLRNQVYGTPNIVNWESKNKLHITLKFLGDVGENVSELILRRFEGIEFPKISSSFSKFAFFKKNDVLKGALGEHIYTYFLAAKNKEWMDYCSAVSQWELDNYLPII